MPSSILRDIFLAFYQPFLFAAAFSYMAMYFYLFSVVPNKGGKGFRHSIKIWNRYFKKSKIFRLLFFLIFVSTIVIFKTLLNREGWEDPLSNVMGQWQLWTTNPESNTLTYNAVAIENLIMLTPFSYIISALFIAGGCELTVTRTMWYGTISAFVFSVSIEVTQLVFHLGTFQLSDLCYNTLGGLIGGALYCLVSKIRNKRNRSK